MWSEGLGIDADDASPQELERSMEREIEGLLELDEMELPPAEGEPSSERYRR